VPIGFGTDAAVFPHGDNAKNSSTWTGRNAGDENDTSGDNR
jgi:hypothetical protein